MSYSNNTVTTPIGIGELNTILSAGRADIGYICRYGNMKMWAKYKGIRYNSLSTPSDSIRADGNRNWGMAWEVFTSPSSQNAGGHYLFDVYENDTSSSARGALNSWQYLRPRGLNGAGVGGHEWYRVLDFNGYYHAATEPVVINAGAIQASTQRQTTVAIAALRKESFNVGELDFDDFDALKDYYYCLVGYRVVGNPDPSTIFIVSAASKISTGLYSASIVFDGTNFTAGRLGNWNIYPCLCSVGSLSYYQVSGSLPAMRLVPLPCTKRWTANIASYQAYAVLNATKSASNHTSMTYRLRIYNDTGSSYTFNGVRVWLMHNYHTPADVMDSDERYIDINGGNGITINGGDYYDTGVVTYTIPSSLWPDLTLYATCSAGFDRVGPIMPLVPN